MHLKKCQSFEFLTCTQKSTAVPLNFHDFQQITFPFPDLLSFISAYQLIMPVCF